MVSQTKPTSVLVDQELPVEGNLAAEGQQPAWRRRAWVAAWVLVGLLVLGGVGAAMVRFPFRGFPFGTGETDSPSKGALSVQTTYPRQMVLERSWEQPGTIQPYSQAELYAKTSGYLLFIRRDVTPAVIAALMGQRMLANGLVGVPAIGQAGWQIGSLAATLHQAPQIDIGSQVEAGDLLVLVDVPERRQDVVEREAALDQRRVELTQSVTSIETFQAGVTVAKAHLVQAKADVQRDYSAYVLRTKQLSRVRSLVRQNAVEKKLEDEKEAEVEAARATYDSGVAKVKAAEAEVKLADSKLVAARGEVEVKQARVRAAISDLERARIMENYGRLHAPFRGTVTYRGVDEGDFVQNSQTGQSRHLMTVTASDRVKVTLQVPSRQGLQVRVGAQAMVSVDSRPGETFSGRVARVRGLLEVKSRTLQVEIDLDNRDGRLMPGMYGHAKLTLSQTPNTWVVPAAVLFSRNKVTYLIVVRDGIARHEPVRVVFDSGGQVEVVKVVGDKEVPLDGTEELVTSGKGAIADGQQVRAVRQAASQ